MTRDRQTRIEVRLEGETVWLSQAQMAELFQTTKQNVSLHIRNLYEEGELTREGTVKESLTVRSEGGREVQREIDLYNLDVGAFGRGRARFEANRCAVFTRR